MANNTTNCPNCDHAPYDYDCDEYTEQPCCGYAVHVDDLDSEDSADHLEECPRFVEDDDVDEVAEVVRAAVRMLQ